MSDVFRIISREELREQAQRMVSAGKPATECLAYAEALYDLRLRERGLVWPPADLGEREVVLLGAIGEVDEAERTLRDAAAAARVVVGPVLAVLGKWLLLSCVVAAEFGVLAWTGGNYLGVDWARGWSNDPAGAGIALSLAFGMTWIMLDLASVAVGESSGLRVASRAGDGWFNAALLRRVLGLVGLMLLGLLAGLTRQRTGVSFLFLTASAVLLPIAAALIERRFKMRRQDLDRFSEVLDQYRRRRQLRRGLTACTRQRRDLVRELDKTRRTMEEAQRLEEVVAGQKEILKREVQIAYAEASRVTKTRPLTAHLTPVPSIKARTYRRASRPAWRWLRVVHGRGRNMAGEGRNTVPEGREGMNG